ncbi:MAG: hypothetical protein IPP83_10515 [Flavobacteriales bacterium]|nr:hypothetical protein [Flavobacteriales bacterium]
MATSRSELFPQQLLFRRHLPHVKTKGPLFRNQLDLASAIASIKGTTYFGKSGSVRALLSQVFRHGGDKHSRSLPTLLKDAIYSAVRTKVDGDFDWSDFEEDFDVSFENLKSEWRDGDAMSSALLEQDLATASRNAKKHWIITRQPAELLQNDFGCTLAERLVENVREGSAEYTFYFADELVAISFWRALRDRLQKEVKSSKKEKRTAPKRKTPDDLLQEWNTKGLIKVFQNRDKRLFLHPYVIFDYDREIGGFVLHYHGGTAVSISKMRREDLEFWQAHEYPNLVSKNNLNPVTYQDMISSPV